MFGLSASGEFLCVFGTGRFTAMYNTARHLFPSWARSVQSTPFQMTLVGSILTFSFLLRLSLPSGLFPSVFPTTTLCSPSSNHTYCMPCPSHSCWLDHPDNILWEVKIMNLLTVQLPPFHCYFVPLRPKYLPRHPVLEHPQPIFFLTVRGLGAYQRK